METYSLKQSVKRFPFPYAGSNMYIIVCGKKALVIDPNVSEDALNYLKASCVDELTVLLTHEHYDHTSGLTWISGKFKSTVICHEITAQSLIKGKNNCPIIIASSRLGEYSKEEVKIITASLPQNYRYEPDITFTNEYCFTWLGHRIKMTSTPGHSLGSCCIAIDDDIVATGDSLINGTKVITRLFGGSEKDFQEKTVPYLRKISPEAFILSGHGDPFIYKDAVLLSYDNE